MSQIKVENLTFAYPGSFDNVFENVSFQFDTDWKLGFVGRNGRGKTTFLRLLQGEGEYAGRITSSVDFDYFPCAVPDKTLTAEAVLEQVCPDGALWALERELRRLELEPELLSRPFGTLSNGEQTKLLLAAMFLNEGHFLLIDEPTNHLDLRGRALVADYLKRKPGFLLVSHDRSFLDSCVDHVLSLNRADVTVRSGSFSAWLEDFTRQQDAELARNEQLKKDIGRLQQSARRAADWSDRAEAGKHGVQSSGLRADSGYVGHKAAKMMKRAGAIEERRQQAVEEKSGLLKNIENADALKLAPLRYFSETLCEFSDVSVCYDGAEPVCAPLRFAVRRGERAALDGRNGSGKSSILKLLTGTDVPHAGTVSRGSGLVISYVPQDPSGLRGSLTEFAAARNIDASQLLTILRKMAFPRAQFEKDMAEFSAGQKKKVLLAASLCEQAHLYVWDEPLNYIDIYTRMQIEALIREYQPAMLFVEHDRAFRDAVATKIISL